VLCYGRTLHIIPKHRLKGRLKELFVSLLGVSSVLLVALWLVDDSQSDCKAVSMEIRIAYYSQIY
jgi:hypothetical protein